MAFLRLSEIRKRFGPTIALDGVSLDLRPGQVHALIGENGAGKSTLMNIVAGALETDAGHMTLDGQPYQPRSPLDARHRGIALIHQELSLCPHLTVAENVLMGLEPSRYGWLDWDACWRQAGDVLREFERRDLRPDRRVADLSIAGRQVVEICRALAARASIFLMDEPTSSLQREDVERLFGLIRGLRGRGLSIIYISHFLEEVREIADDYTVLRDGRSVGTGPLGTTTNDELIGLMVGRPMQDLFPPRPRAVPGEIALEVGNLQVPPWVREASFTLRRGQVLGVAGLVGSGRTEMVRALMGLLPASSGEVRVAASRRTARRAQPWQRIAQRVGYLSEDRKGEGLALTMSVADNMTLTGPEQCGRWGWLDLGAQRREAQRWVRELRIRARSVSQPVRSLSGGNQQKVAFGRLLHQQAEVLLLDEPTRGIDIGSKSQIYEAIVRCAGEGRAILFVSSYLPELFGLCDSLAVMSRGRLSPTRPIEEWTPESVMETAIGNSEFRMRNAE
jgi:ribose transport system ATP-binding protein